MVEAFSLVCILRHVNPTLDSIWQKLEFSADFTADFSQPQVDILGVVGDEVLAAVGGGSPRTDRSLIRDLLCSVGQLFHLFPLVLYLVPL